MAKVGHQAAPRKTPKDSGETLSFGVFRGAAWIRNRIDALRSTSISWSRARGLEELVATGEELDEYLVANSLLLQRDQGSRLRARERPSKQAREEAHGRAQQL